MTIEPSLALRKTRRRLALAASAVAALVALAACAPKPSADAPAAVTASNVTLTADQRAHIRLYTVTSAPFSRSIEAVGAVDFDNDQATSVLAAFSGPVSKLLVEAGDKVRKGQPLALVDSSDFATAVGAYSKALATARTDRKLADADEDLVQHNGVSQREAQQAETDAVNAEADRDAALKGLVSLGVDPQTLKALQQGQPVSHFQGVIRAPIAGTVAEKLITPGQLLQAGTTACFTIADLSKVWVLAQVADGDLAAVKVGDSAQVLSSAAPNGVTGTVDNISALVNPDTRATIARVVVANPGELLKKQMYVRVQIHSRQPTTGLVVPVSAVLRDDENLPFVYVVQADGSFARQHVTLGERAGDDYNIAAGLQPGARIVDDGGIFIQFMQSQ
jgi:cobalt-zinc-cadmium efflux system membrane fusion protein